MLLVQISDLHWRPDGAWRAHSPEAALARALAFVAAMRPLPDAVVITGDLLDRSAADYGPLLALLTPCPVPLMAIPGNHDQPTAFRNAFSGQPFAEDHASFVLPVAGGTLIGLDSSGPEGQPQVSPAQMRWLAQALDCAHGPVVLALHHPPFATGIWDMDRNPLAGAKALENTVRGRVSRVLCGHTHRAITTLWAGAQASCGPPLAHALALQLAEGVPPDTSHEGPALQVHRHSTNGWTSYTVLLSALGGRPGEY